MIESMLAWIGSWNAFDMALNMSVTWIKFKSVIGVGLTGIAKLYAKINAMVVKACSTSDTVRKILLPPRFKQGMTRSMVWRDAMATKYVTKVKHSAIMMII